MASPLAAETISWMQTFEDGCRGGFQSLCPG